MEATAHSALVALSGVHQQYRCGSANVHALYDLDLRIEAGEMLAVCAPSGHGKTALMNLLALLDRPSAGTIVFDGHLIESLTEQQRAALRSASIGLVCQQTTLIPVLTAQENVLLSLQLRQRLKQTDRQAERALAAELLARLGLATQLSKYPCDLDPSQRQRVAIARALVTHPRLVVADEPTSRLDSGSVRMVIELFSAWRREHGTAFVIATRDQRQLLSAPRTVQLSEGRILGAPADTPRWIAKECA
jgi:ABC-type lipoprotein export system ATPase subunit